jgi:hypothetical protein
LPKQALIEPQDVRIYLDVIVKPGLYETTSDIILDQRLFHGVEEVFDKPCQCFIIFQRKFRIDIVLEIPEKIQVKTLKYLTRARRESNDLHEMISKSFQ